MLSTLVAIESLVATDLVIEASYESRLITLEDLEGFFHFLRRVVDALEPEISRVVGSDMVLVTDVSVSHGSAKAKVNVKASGGVWNDASKTAAATILAAAIGLIPTVLGSDEPDEPIDPAPISYECVQLVSGAVREMNATTVKVQKSYKVKFRVKCQGAEVESTFEPIDPTKKA